MWETKIENCYVKIYRKKQLICTAIIDGNLVHDITFFNEKMDVISKIPNKTRQKAIEMIQNLGYR